MSLERHLAVHLQQMYVAERDYQMYLCDQSGKITDRQLKSAISAEITGMNSEMDGLKNCLHMLGEPLDEDMVSQFVKAFRQEDQISLQSMPIAPTDVDVHIAMADISFGGWEIGVYQGIIVMARALNRMDIVKVLESIIQDEEKDLQTITQLMKQLIELSRQQRAA